MRRNRCSILRLGLITGAGLFLRANSNSLRNVRLFRFYLLKLQYSFALPSADYAGRFRYEVAWSSPRWTFLMTSSLCLWILMMQSLDGIALPQAAYASSGLRAAFNILVGSLGSTSGQGSVSRNSEISYDMPWLWNRLPHFSQCPLEKSVIGVAVFVSPHNHLCFLRHDIDKPHWRYIFVCASPGYNSLELCGKPQTFGMHYLTHENITGSCCRGLHHSIKI